MKPTVKLSPITPESIALFLARNPIKRHKSRKPAKSSSPPEEIAEDFMLNWSSARLLDVLKDARGRKIDIKWIVERYLDILDREDIKPAEETAIVDRLQSFLVIGAIQDPKLAEHLQRKLGVSPKGPGAKEHSDPFKGLTVKMPKTG